MKYCTTAEAAAKWGVSDRMICIWCREQRIEGAVRSGRSWRIPADADRPASLRGHSAGDLHRDLIHLAGDATWCERTSPANLSEEDYRFCEIKQMVLRGEIEQAGRAIDDFLENCRRDYRAPALVIRYVIRYYLGYDIRKQAEADDFSYFLTSGHYPLAEAYLSAYFGLPDTGRPCPHLTPSVRIQILLKQDERALVDFLRSKDPAIGLRYELHCQMAEELQMDEIAAYYHALLATYYYILDDEVRHDFHVGRALRIIVPRKWYFIIAEYDYCINWNPERFLDEETCRQVKTTCETFLESYITPGFARFLKTGDGMPTEKMLRIAFFLIARCTNREIAERLGITLYEVKKTVKALYLITGCSTREEIAESLLNGILKR